MQKSGFINRTASVLNVLAAFALLLCYLPWYISPEKLWVTGFISLSYPYFLFINLAFLIYWSIQRKRLFLLSLLAVGAGFNHIPATLQLHYNNTPPEGRTPIKIMSYNVRVFDLYNWKHFGEGRKKIFNLIAEESPDVLCFQEFFTSDSRKFNNLDSLAARQKACFVHFEPVKKLYTDDYFGIATFSAFPIVNKGRINFEGKTHNLCIFSDIKVNEDTLRIFNVHLQSVRFEETDYRFVENLKNENQEEDVKGFFNIVRKLKRAFIMRAAQVDLIEKYIRKSPYPVILCGDFNDTPSSYTYHRLTSALSDSFIESGFGFGKTYAGGVFPSFRIDYILHDENFRAYSFRKLSYLLSDHYPVTCFIDINK